MTDQVNIPLLRKAVEWAEAEAAKPREFCQWYQVEVAISPEQIGRDASCGTCYCVAGFIAAEVNGPELYGVMKRDLISEAIKALGLDESVVATGGLFYAYNTIADVRRIAEDLAGEQL